MYVSQEVFLYGLFAMAFVAFIVGSGIERKIGEARDAMPDPEYDRQMQELWDECEVYEYTLPPKPKLTPAQLEHNHKVNELVDAMGALNKVP